MNNKDRLKYIGPPELFRLRDALKIVLAYFNLKELKQLQEEIKDRLEELKGGEPKC